nr:hypothetical protein [Actinopolyspora righensis]
MEYSSKMNEWPAVSSGQDIPISQVGDGAFDRVAQESYPSIGFFSVEVEFSVLWCFAGLSDSISQITETPDGVGMIERLVQR